MKLFTTTIILSLFVWLSTDIAHAQNWATYQENEVLRIEISDWNALDKKTSKDHDLIIFRYTNLTDQELVVHFKREYDYSNNGVSTPDTGYNLVLAPNSTSSYMDHQGDKTYYIFKKDNNGWIKSVLIDFRLKDLTTE